MIGLFFRFTFYFVLSFFVMAIPIRQRTLFDHLYQFASPITVELYGIIGPHLRQIMGSGKSLAKKLISNATPVADQVQVQVAAPRRNQQRPIAKRPLTSTEKAPRGVPPAHPDSYTEGERKRLQELLD